MALRDTTNVLVVARAGGGGNDVAVLIFRGSSLHLTVPGSADSRAAQRILKQNAPFLDQEAAENADGELSATLFGEHARDRRDSFTIGNISVIF